MRLIDADRFKNWMVENYILYDGDKSLKDIDEQPTVQAIPIEWITDWLTKQSIPATSYGIDYSAVEKMLEDWEKENEVD